jgi:hypothetical protein
MKMHRFLLTLLFCVLCSVSAFAQRQIATGLTIFYAAPNGMDLGNNCLSQTAPCTPQGAINQITNKWDFANAINITCQLNLAAGTYNGDLKFYGSFVGTHVCNVLGAGWNGSACTNADLSQINGVMDFQDGGAWAIACFKLIGSRGINVRQVVPVLDIAEVDCAVSIVCIQTDSKVNIIVV